VGCCGEAGTETNHELCDFTQLGGSKHRGAGQDPGQVRTDGAIPTPESCEQRLRYSVAGSAGTGAPHRLAEGAAGDGVLLQEGAQDLGAMLVPGDAEVRQQRDCTASDHAKEADDGKPADHLVGQQDGGAVVVAVASEAVAIGANGAAAGFRGDQDGGVLLVGLEAAGNWE